MHILYYDQVATVAYFLGHLYWMLYRVAQKSKPLSSIIIISYSSHHWGNFFINFDYQMSIEYNKYVLNILCMN